MCTFDCSVIGIEAAASRFLLRTKHTPTAITNANNTTPRIDKPMIKPISSIPPLVEDKSARVTVDVDDVRFIVVVVGSLGIVGVGVWEFVPTVDCSVVVIVDGAFVYIIVVVDVVFVFDVGFIAVVVVVVVVVAGGG